jgi:hypothetical protein
LKRAIRTISATTAASAYSSSAVFGLTYASRDRRR